MLVVLGNGIARFMYPALAAPEQLDRVSRCVLEQKPARSTQRPCPVGFRGWWRARIRGLCTDHPPASPTADWYASCTAGVSKPFSDMIFQLLTDLLCCNAAALARRPQDQGLWGPCVVTTSSHWRCNAACHAQTEGEDGVRGAMRSSTRRQWCETSSEGAAVRVKHSPPASRITDSGLPSRTPKRSTSKDHLNLRACFTPAHLRARIRPIIVLSAHAAASRPAA